MEELLLAVTLLETMEDQVHSHHLMALAEVLVAVEIQVRVDPEDLEAEADREVQRALEMLEVTHHQKEILVAEVPGMEAKVEEAQQTLEVTVLLVLVVTEEQSVLILLILEELLMLEAAEDLVMELDPEARAEAVLAHKITLTLKVDQTV